MPLEFKSSYNCESANRGWVVDMVEAFQNELRVGYIKISYISQENYKNNYASPVDYMVRIGGWCPKYDGSFKSHMFDRKIIKSLAWYAWSNNELNSQIDTMNDAEVLLLASELESYVGQSYKKQIKDFKIRWLNNPVVDFIRVNESHQRRGIATQLYIHASRMMNEKGLLLRASEIQSAPAKACWDKFITAGFTIKRGKYLYLKKEFQNAV